VEPCRELADLVVTGDGELGLAVADLIARLDLGA